MHKAERDPKLNNAKDCSEKPKRANGLVLHEPRTFAPIRGLVPSGLMALEIAVHQYGLRHRRRYKLLLPIVLCSLKRRQIPPQISLAMPEVSVHLSVYPTALLSLA
jgi:hypothetical protein